MAGLGPVGFPPDVDVIVARNDNYTFGLDSDSQGQIRQCILRPSRSGSGQKKNVRISTGADRTRRARHAHDIGLVWFPTLCTLLLLRPTGVNRADPSVDSAVARLEASFRWDQEFRGKPFTPLFEGKAEPYLRGTLAFGALHNTICVRRGCSVTSLPSGPRRRLRWPAGEARTCDRR